MTNVVCPNCEANNKSDATLCVACGQPLKQRAEDREEVAGGHEVHEQVDDWVRQLPESGRLAAENLDAEDQSLPDWLQSVRAHADKLSDDEADELLDFLAKSEPKDPATGSSGRLNIQTDQEKKQTADLPSWMAELEAEETGSEANEAGIASRQSPSPDHEDEDGKVSTAPLTQTRPLVHSAELDGIPELLASDDLPEWLAEQQGVSLEPGSDQQFESTERPASRHTGQFEGDVAGSGEESEPGSTVDDLEAILSELEVVSQQESGSRDADLATLSEELQEMDSARAAALEESLEQIMDLTSSSDSTERVDQWLDILDGLPREGESEQLGEMIADADSGVADVPDWMHSLQPEVATAEDESLDLGPPAAEGPLAGLRGVVPAAAVSLTGNPDRTISGLTLTKEERQQAALLRQLTASGSEASADADAKSGDAFLISRVLVGGALLLVILLGLLLPGAADLVSSTVKPSLPLAASEAAEVIAANRGGTTLVAFDYTPTMSGELDAVANALLEDLAANDMAVVTVSQVAAGVPMAEEAVESVEGLTSEAIGYLPGEASGLRAIGACLSQKCESLIGRNLSPELQSALADVNLIVLLAADRDSLVGWIEQVGTQNDVPMIGGVTQALGPVARSYFLSEQLAGLVEGVPGGMGYAAARQLDGAVADGALAGITLAQWLSIVLILAGALYFGLAKPAASAASQVAKK